MSITSIPDYLRKPAFAGFLPGIAGMRGIPIWCCYVNRGQVVASFGSEDKDHAILEFSPMSESCRNVSSIGFRTFIRNGNTIYEPFQDARLSHDLEIGLNYVKIHEYSQTYEITVRYYTLTEEKAGALVRELEVKNTSDTTADIDILDGLACLVPYGVSNSVMKSMGQTAQAWMMAEDVEHGTPYFKTRASIEDSITVSEVTKGNFAQAIDSSGNRLIALVDPVAVFGYDTSLKHPVNFASSGLEGLRSTKQMTQNRLPCCFFGQNRILTPGETLSQFSLYGRAENKPDAREVLKKYLSAQQFSSAFIRAVALTDNLTDVVSTKTSHTIFDAYCRQSYLDNLLRGGIPISIGRNLKDSKENHHGIKTFYIYARKHGDLERDYNFFSVPPTFYSCGEGSYRDVNQNRRCDVLFKPDIGRANIKTFFDLIGLDGYNPRTVESSCFILDDDARDEICSMVCSIDADTAAELLSKPFLPGTLLMEAEKWKLKDSTSADELMNHAVALSRQETCADFHEGYWTDHWTYNLDLIESYLSVFPEKETELLFEQRDYLYFESNVTVHPRARRYVETARGIRQYNTLDYASKTDTRHKWAEENGSNREFVCSALIEKLILLCTLKYANLDPHGIGIEMEGGRPGWYDALNGLPGLLGSSVNDSCELARLLDFVISALKKYGRSVEMYLELYELVKTLAESSWDWNHANDAKERYREKIYHGVSGKRKTIDTNTLTGILSCWNETVKSGIGRAEDERDGICPSYYYYDVTDFYKDDKGIHPKTFVRYSMPLFLEGPVRRMRLNLQADKKSGIHTKVKSSNLYDRKLKMFKVNESLSSVTYEAGRATAFSPGWLENESIWLHMEYKYLLELLRSGMYDEFAACFRDAAIPFLDFETYGRSLTENSSFIASSANPDSSIHGRGFVARLSGSTAEFLSIWQLMMIGPAPVIFENGALTLNLRPFIPNYLMPSEGIIETTLFGSTRLHYHTNGLTKLCPGEYKIIKYALFDRMGNRIDVESPRICPEKTLDIRSGKFEKITVYIQKA